MALSQKKLAAKRAKRNQARKNVKYNPNKKYFTVQNGQAVRQVVEHDSVKDTITV